MYISFFAVVVRAYNVKLSENLCWFFLFFSFSCSTKIDSVYLFMNSHALTSDLKNAVSPRNGTITSPSINTEGGSAAFVLTRKQRRSRDRSRLSGIEQLSSSNFSNVCCLSCCHIAFIVRSHFSIDREAAVPSLP